MDRREVDEIEAFLSQVGQPSLLEYYGLSVDSSDADKEAAIKKRRAWAQGQQANPKHKSEAMFLIKNNGVVRRLLVDDFDAYRAAFLGSEVPEKLDELMAFLTATLGASTKLTPQGEAAVKLRGRQLGLAENALEQRITEGLERLGAERGSSASVQELPPGAKSTDYYEVLHAPPTASTQDLEIAYRARYRWSRNLKDLKRSSEFLSQLDEAWRVLRNPEKRARYDELRREAIEMTDEVERAAAEALRERMREFEAGETVVHSPPPFEMNLPAAGAAAPVESPPAPHIAGRTLGLADGPQPVRERAPRLSVAGPLHVALRVGSRPVEHKLQVQNLGQGRMYGRVSSDVPWIVPRPAQLDPGVRDQLVYLEVRPNEIPRRQAVGAVTVVADHGERRVVSVAVTRSPGLLPYAIFVLLFLVVATAVVLAGRAVLTSGPLVATPVSVTVEVSPPADHVYVNDVEVGQGASVAIADAAPNSTLDLRVEAAGFEPWTESLRVGVSSVTRKVELSLTDPMTWRPPTRASGGTPSSEALATLNRLGPPLGRCLPAGTAGGSVTATVWIQPAGEVRGLELSEAAFDTKPVDRCFRRVFWMTKLPAFPEDYQKASLLLTVAPA